MPYDIRNRGLTAVRALLLGGSACLGATEPTPRTATWFSTTFRHRRCPAR